MLAYSKLVSSTFLTVVMLTGCAKLGDDLPAEATPLMPLKVGNYWINHIQRSVGDSLLEDKIDTVRIDTAFQIRGRSWYRIGECRSIVRSIFTNTTRGLVSVTLKDDLSFDLNSAGVSPYPAKVGTKVVAERLVSIDSTVTVPAGTFSGCYVWHNQIDGLGYSAAYKPGVGRLFFRAFNRHSGYEFRCELTAYHLK